MPTQSAKQSMNTHLMRTPVTGPDPANTLVYLHGRALGLDGAGSLGVWDHQEISFRTEFQIDGYEQQHHEWYEANTLVSATAMLRFLNTETDLIFTFAINGIAPFLDQDGTVGFTVEYAQYIDDEAIFPASKMITQLGAVVSAYVLCFEPRTRRPPSGPQGGVWGKVSDRGETLAGLRWAPVAEISGTYRRSISRGPSRERYFNECTKP